MDNPRPVSANERLVSYAGYKDWPTVHTALSFALPAFSRVVSRIVAAAERSWEAWSPNASSHAFYPGLADADVVSEASLLPWMRRADGHLGRFDPTRWPQVLRHDRLWYAFVRPETEAPLTSYPEFTPFHSVWEVQARSFPPPFLALLSRRVTVIMSGVNLCPRFETAYPALWLKRPTRPSAADVAALGETLSYDMALDRYTEFQRLAKLASAWAKMAQAMLDYPPSTVFNPPLRPASPAFMGAWVNGASMEDGFWLLQVGVPCHILHEIESYEMQDWALGASRGPYRSFATDTPLQALMDNASEADLAMERLGWRLNDLAKDESIASAEPMTSWVDRCRSSSYGQGWNRGKYSVPRFYRTPELEEDGFILPPPVLSTIGLAGKWSLWEQDSTDDNEIHMVRKGYGQGGNSSRVFYDRVNRRALSFSTKVSCPRHYIAPVDVFGLPAPDVPYVTRYGQGLFRQSHASTWMYKDLEPKAGDAERVYQPLSDRRSAMEQAAAMDVDDPGEFLPSPIAPLHDLPAEPLPRERSRSLSRHSSSSPRVSLGQDLSPRSPLQSACHTRAPSPKFFFPVQRGRSASPPSRLSSPPRSPRDVYLPPHRRGPPASYQRVPSLSRRRSPSPPRGRVRSPLRRRVASPPRRRVTPPRQHRSPPRRLPPPTVNRWTRRRSRSPSPARFRRQSPPRRRRPPTPSPRRWSPPRNRRRFRSPSPVAGPSRLPLALRLASPGRPRPRSPSPVWTVAVRQPARDLERLQELIPAAPRNVVPILREFGAETRFLVVSNLPVYYAWGDVMQWLRRAVHAAGFPEVLRVLRSAEAGHQIFLVALRTVTGAAALRGVMSQRFVADSPDMCADFVSAQTYSNHSSAYRDAWSPDYGMEVDNRPKSGLTLRDRLHVPPVGPRPSHLPPPLTDLPKTFLAPPPAPVQPSTRRRVRAGRRRPRLDPADGGAL